MILITSASYLNSEFNSEFGETPSSFLPLNGMKIYNYQINNLKKKFKSEKIFLSIPSDFVVSKLDEKILKIKNITIIRIKKNISLSKSIYLCLDKIQLFNETFRILHGDTIIYDIPNYNNCISISNTHFDYNWEVKDRDFKNNTVWSGYFSFADINSIRSYLKKYPNNFEKAVKEYQLKHNSKFYKSKKWFDYGHLNSYFHSRSKNIQSRYFNNIEVKKNIVYKKSKKRKNKILKEYLWYYNLPTYLKKFTPQIYEYDKKNSSYSTEYLTLVPLNEIYVHCQNREFYWYGIFNAIKNWFDNAKIATNSLNKSATQEIQEIKRELIENKTQKRVNKYLQTININSQLKFTLNGNISPSIDEIIRICVDKCMKVKIISGIMHGDLCLSNLFYSPRNNIIKVVDPRGFDKTLNGDLAYDYAKLSHSILGLYDFIISGAYDLNIIDKQTFNLEIYEDDNIKNIQKIFKSYKFIKNINYKDTLPFVVLLFLSMAYLHIDDKKRALALFLNGIKIYNNYLK